MRKRVRIRAVGVLVAAASAVLGGVLAASTAYAVPAPPTSIDIDSNANKIDNYVNAFEVGAVTVTGQYDTAALPAVDNVRVQIVNSATCNSGALEQTPDVNAVLDSPNPGEWTATFDVSSFSEGAVLCARARASNDGKPHGAGKHYSAVATSTDFPVKDTVVVAPLPGGHAGSVVIVDPRDDGFLNTDETLNGTVSADYTAADADASRVDFWWGQDGAATAYGDPSCGTPPAVDADYVAPSSGNDVLTAACAASIPEGDTLSLNAQWADDAGNVSLIASADAPTSRPLVKDTTAPARAKVQMLTTDYVGGIPGAINAANAAGVLVRVEAELGATIKLGVSDGVNTLTQQKLSTAPQPVNFLYNTTSLNDCDDADVDPNTGLLSDSSAPEFVLPECIVAHALVTDPAGNVDDGPALPVVEPAFVEAGYNALDGIDTTFKDATNPETPIIQIIPGNIQTDINTIIEVEVTGAASCAADCDRDYSTVQLTLSDEDPGTPDVTDTLNTYQGDVAVYLDSAPLTDGIITATATLTDGLGNVSAAGVTTANKGLTTPSVVVTSPASNSLNTENVRISGTATPLSKVTVFNKANNEPIITNIPVDAAGAWSANYRFLTSGVKTIYARKIGDNVGSNVRAFEVDAIKPTATILTPNLTTYTPGQPLLIDGTASDDWSGVAAVRIDVYDARNTRPTPNMANPTASEIRYGLPVVTDVPATCAGCATFQKNVSWSYDLTGQVGRGAYVVQATPIDKAGNRAAQPTQITIVVLD